MRYKTPTENWVPREQAPAFDRNRYPPALLARAAAAWLGLCQDERESVDRRDDGDDRSRAHGRAARRSWAWRRG